jgi:hypothetical protein
LGAQLLQICADPLLLAFAFRDGLRLGFRFEKPLCFFCCVTHGVPFYLEDFAERYGSLSRPAAANAHVVIVEAAKSAESKVSQPLFKRSPRGQVTVNRRGAF